MICDTVIQVLFLLLTQSAILCRSRFTPVLPEFVERGILRTVSMIANGDPGDGDAAMLTVPDLIQMNGYPVETHKVLTEDGYILQIHRIPHSDKCEEFEGDKKRVALLQHGIFCDSSNWVMTGSNQSLGFLLADKCYDVWLGNFRGTTYGRRHINLKPFWHRKAFWDFSFHEMGIYDLPAMIDYVIKKTKVDSISYVGHSMGTTSFFAMMSEKPEYNKKIRFMGALAPVAYLHDIRMPMAEFVPFMGFLERLSRMFGVYEILPNELLYKILAITLCNEHRWTRILCSFQATLVTGFNPENVGKDFSQQILQRLPAGTSVKTVNHFAQIILSRHFGQYDYGSRNTLMYAGEENPPDYNLTRVEVPVAAYWGPDDWAVSAENVLATVGSFPNVVSLKRVDRESFGHMDFVLAKDQAELVHNHLIDLMNKF